ncbi:MAG TPA: MBL fold metallo-hydrolase [Candidatus Paceibacterota bacterium]|nr:MBL fold metallo-hydrolase [Candidatus Paceibacterota bacterium]
MMNITNLNPDFDIGATSWLVELEGHRLLLDAGTHPKREGRAGLPLYGEVGNQKVDAIAITHCHHDHVGSLPIALRHFPRAEVLMTELSYFLVERVLHNSVNVMTRQRDELGIGEYPLYTHDEVDEVAAVFQGFKYNREVDWVAPPRAKAGFLSPTLEFLDAGHVLGSAGIMVRGRQESLFFTGDVSFHDQTLLRRACFEDVKADVLILETTRGNRNLPADFSREAEVDRLAESIRRVLARKGSVLIPSFALGRTQEILALLAVLVGQGKLKPQPIFIGGLARVFTEIYDLEAHRTHRQYPNLELHKALNLVVLDPGQIEKISLQGGRLFVVTAGMMNENTAAHDLALRLMSDERHAIFFVGYTDPDTPGGHLKASQPGQPFHFSARAGEVVRQCEVQEFDLTAHANRDDLLDFVGQVEPRVVLLSHGEADSRNWFETQINTRYPAVRVIQPAPGQTVSV